MCENCEYLKKAKACKKEINEDNLMYEALCEKKEDEEYIEDNKYNDITLDEATENYYDYGVEYEKVKERPINNKKDKVQIVEYIQKIMTISRKKKITIKFLLGGGGVNSEIARKSMGDEENGNNTKEETNKKDLELTDDLFNLIDSMYDEGKD